MNFEIVIIEIKCYYGGNPFLCSDDCPFEFIEDDEEKCLMGWKADSTKPGPNCLGPGKHQFHPAIKQLLEEREARNK